MNVSDENSLLPICKKIRKEAFMCTPSDNQQYDSGLEVEISLPLDEMYGHNQFENTFYSTQTELENSSQFDFLLNVSSEELVEDCNQNKNDRFLLMHILFRQTKNNGELLSPVELRADKNLQLMSATCEMLNDSEKVAEYMDNNIYVTPTKNTKSSRAAKAKTGKDARGTYDSPYVLRSTKSNFDSLRTKQSSPSNKRVDCENEYNNTIHSSIFMSMNSGNKFKEIHETYCNRTSKGRWLNSFPGKLFKIVSSCKTEAIGWEQCGKRLFIIPHLFEQEFLQTGLFRTRKYESFIRQMNLYGFRKCRRSSIKWEEKIAFEHPYFIRDRKDLLTNIYRLDKRTKMEIDSNLKSKSKCWKEPKNLFSIEVKKEEEIETQIRSDDQVLQPIYTCPQLQLPYITLESCYTTPNIVYPNLTFQENSCDSSSQKEVIIRTLNNSDIATIKIEDILPE